VVRESIINEATSVAEKSKIIRSFFIVVERPLDAFLDLGDAVQVETRPPTLPLLLIVQLLTVKLLLPLRISHHRLVSAGRDGSPL
jgi:hypothetical protein